MKFRRIETDYVAIILIVFCLVCIGLNELFNPANIIARAVDKSFCEYNARETANSPWLNEELDKNIENGNLSVDFALNSTEGNLKNAGISLKLDRNDSKKAAQANFNLNYNGTALLALDAYADNDNVILKAPALYEKNLSVDTDFLSKNIYAMSGIHYDADTKQNIFFDPAVKDNTYNYAFDYVSNGVTTSGRKAWRSINDYVELTSLEKTEVNGLNCKGYEIKVNSEGSKIFLTTFGEALFTDSSFKKGLASYFEKDYNANPMLYQLYYGISSGEQLADMIISAYQNMYNNMVENSEIGDITLQIYINSGRLISFQSTGFLTSQGAQLDVNSTLNFDGTDKPTDNLNAKLSFYSEGNDLSFEFADTNENVDNNLTTNKSFSYYLNGDAFTVTAATTYNQADNGFTFNAGFEQNDYEIIRANVQGTVVSEDGYISADADSINITGEDQLSGEGHLYIQPLDNEITPIEGEAVDISGAEEDEVNEIMSTIQTKLNEIFSKIGA